MIRESGLDLKQLAVEGGLAVGTARALVGGSLFLSDPANAKCLFDADAREQVFHQTSNSNEG